MELRTEQLFQSAEWLLFKFHQFLLFFPERDLFGFLQIGIRHLLIQRGQLSFDKFVAQKFHDAGFTEITFENFFRFSNWTFIGQRLRDETSRLSVFQMREKRSCAGVLVGMAAVQNDEK